MPTSTPTAAAMMTMLNGFRSNRPPGPGKNGTSFEFSGEDGVASGAPALPVSVICVVLPSPLPLAIGVTPGSSAGVTRSSGFEPVVSAPGAAVGCAPAAFTPGASVGAIPGEDTLGAGEGMIGVAVGAVVLLTVGAGVELGSGVRLGSGVLVLARVLVAVGRGVLVAGGVLVLARVLVGGIGVLVLAGVFVGAGVLVLAKVFVGAGVGESGVLVAAAVAVAVVLSVGVGAVAAVPVGVAVGVGVGEAFVVAVASPAASRCPGTSASTERNSTAAISGTWPRTLHPFLVPIAFLPPPACRISIST